MFRKRKFKYSTTYYRKIKDIKRTTSTNNDNNDNVRQSEDHSIRTFSNKDNYKQQNIYNDESVLLLTSDRKISDEADSISPKDEASLEENKEENDFSDDSPDIEYNVLLGDEPNMDSIKLRSSLREELRDWALSDNISHQALTGLLKLLRRNGIPSLPQDSRTLLCTIKNVEIHPMGQGEFWYHGISLGLKQMLIDIIKENTTLGLNFHIDGLPLTSSSKQQFWPILMSISNFPYISPGPICIYSGPGKPPSAELFMQQFILELIELLENGLMINGHSVRLYVSAILCDTPARCFIKCTVPFNAYHSCQKCVVVGQYYHAGRHMSFPQLECPLRTNESFRTKSDPDHHQKIKDTGEPMPSPLEQLPIDMIRDIPIADSLHLIDLGLMKRCLSGWTNGSYNFKNKFFIPQVEIISRWLVDTNYTMPREIHRSVRGLDTLSFWKATEYRTFLLYLGPVILKDHLPRQSYRHFLMIMCAVTICSTKLYLRNPRMIQVAQQLFKDYVDNFISIYGEDSISSNIHNLIHVADDIKQFGPFPNISTYEFENTLGIIKNLLRNGNRPLAQVAKRVVELYGKKNPYTDISESYPLLKYEEHDTNFIPNRHYKAYKCLKLSEGIELKSNPKDQWFLLHSKSIVKMLCTYVHENIIYLYGCSLKKQVNFFEYPFDSNYLNIYMSTCGLNKPESYKISDLKCKMVSLKYNDKYVFFPLLHTLDLLNQ